MFRTELNITPSDIKIGLHDPILTIGSCFSDSIGSKFSENKFNVLANPFGTVYNPISIFKSLELSFENYQASEDGFVENEGLFSHYDFHSSFASTDKIELENNLATAISSTSKFSKELKFLIITFGTAFVYERKDNHQIVANCHKVPAKEFEKKLLTQKQIIEAFEALYPKLPNDLNIILTVSPVRHIKDTLEMNSVGKSTLRITCDTLSKEYKNISYFPSYEILLDDLRDYRFYASDMLHPTPEAENYIWNKFSNAYFDDQTKEFIDSWGKIRAALSHRPFNPESDKHQSFLKSTIKKIETLEVNLDFNKEIKMLKDQLISNR